MEFTLVMEDWGWKPSGVLWAALWRFRKMRSLVWSFKGIPKTRKHLTQYLR